jgi:hypothetical protein
MRTALCPSSIAVCTDDADTKQSKNVANCAGAAARTRMMTGDVEMG